jgi:hypothetical protein
VKVNLNGWMNGWLNGWMNGWMNGWSALTLKEITLRGFVGAPYTTRVGLTL